MPHSSNYISSQLVLKKTPSQTIVRLLQLHINYLSTFVGGRYMITHCIQLFIWIFSGNDYNVISTTMNGFNPAIDRVVIDDYLAFLQNEQTFLDFYQNEQHHQK